MSVKSTIINITFPFMKAKGVCCAIPFTVSKEKENSGVSPGGQGTMVHHGLVQSETQGSSQ